MLVACGASSTVRSVFPPADLVVRTVPVDSLLDLRRRVLRANDPNARVTDQRDPLAEAIHLGGFLGPQLVAGVSFYPAETPFTSSLPSMQLRWMAVNPIFQRQGVGSALLERAEQIVLATGARQVWANARDTSLDFYRSQGWTVIEGSSYVAPPPALLPHTAVFKVLDGGDVE